jgi:subtilisin family serine protease
MASSRSQIQVRVLDVEGHVLKTAAVAAIGAGTDVIQLTFDERLRAYTVSDLQRGSYLLKVSAPELEAQQRTVVLTDRSLRETFVLGRAGLPFYYQDRVKVPFDLPDLLAVALKPGMDQRTADLNQVAEDFGLEPMPVDATITRQQVRVFNVPADRANDAVLFEQRAARQDFVRFVGKVVRFDVASISLLTNECVVKFRPEADGEAAVRAKDLELVRRLPYSKNGFLLRAKPTMSSSQLLDICNRWAEDSSVIWAEPNLVSTIVPHATPAFPNDPEFPQQLHHPIIGSQGAWNVIRTAPALADTVIAVVDVGCDTNHPDLVGNLTEQFNFAVLNTNLLQDPHGTKSSGIAAGVIDNGIGIAGVAGFSKFMAIQIPNGSDENYAAMFVWCAGLDAGHAGDPLFPPQLARGADIISNSWGLRNRTLSGVISDAFDELAVSGRNGLGCVVLFSTGNDDENFTNLFPWATHPAVISVGASTISPPDPAEVRVSDSNFGPTIDVCAPGGDKSAGGALTSSSTAASSPGSNDYADFGQTSCACAQVAGVAALMLAINPNLTAEEVRQILHDTAVKIDAANTDPIGAYDADGHSQWYGFGRTDAHAAVLAARNASTAPVTESAGVMAGTAETPKLGSS